MASTIKVDTITTPDGTGNISVDRPLSGSGAGLTSLPAANLTGALPAISGASLTGLSAGAWAVKSSGTFSTTTSLDITSVSKTTRIIVDNIILSSDAGYVASLRFSTDNGSSWITSSTYDVFQTFNESVLTNTNRMSLGVGSWGGTTNEGFSGQITIHGPNNTTANTIATWNLLGPNTSGTIKNAVGGGRVQGSNNVNAIQLFAYATSFASGSYTVLELN